MATSGEDLRMTFTTSIPTKPSRLLALPLELQLMIYEEALVYPHALAVNKRCVIWAWAMEVPKKRVHARLTTKHVALTQTSRFVREATLPVFYERNRFQVDCIEPYETIRHVVTWLAGLGPERRLWIHSLHFVKHYDIWHWVESHLPYNLLRSPIVLEMNGQFQIEDLEHDGRAWQRGHSSAIFGSKPYSHYKITFVPKEEVGREIGHEDISDALELLFSGPDAADVAATAASESMPYEDVAHAVNELRQLFTYLKCDVSSIRQCLHAHLALSPMPSCLNGRPDSGERHIGLASLATNWMQPACEYRMLFSMREEDIHVFGTVLVHTSARTGLAGRGTNNPSRKGFIAPHPAAFGPQIDFFNRKIRDDDVSHYWA
jgi:hypothetical protein